MATQYFNISRLSGTQVTLLMRICLLYSTDQMLKFLFHLVGPVLSFLPDSFFENLGFFLFRGWDICFFTRLRQLILFYGMHRICL